MSVGRKAVKNIGELRLELAARVLPNVLMILANKPPEKLVPDSITMAFELADELIKRNGEVK